MSPPGEGGGRQEDSQSFLAPHVASPPDNPVWRRMLSTSTSATTSGQLPLSRVPAGTCTATTRLRARRKCAAVRRRAPPPPTTGGSSVGGPAVAGASLASLVRLRATARPRAWLALPPAAGLRRVQPWRPDASLARLVPCLSGARELPDLATHKFPRGGRGRSVRRGATAAAERWGRAAVRPRGGRRRILLLVVDLDEAGLRRAERPSGRLPNPPAAWLRFRAARALLGMPCGDRADSWVPPADGVQKNPGLRIRPAGAHGEGKRERGPSRAF